MAPLRLAWMALVLAVAATTATARVLTDDPPCSSFLTCKDCLNLASSNARPYCGWCHSDVVYQNGTIGGQCADVRDQWKCNAVFDTYQCTAGWVCDFNTGTCHTGAPGEGYPDQTTCQQHCFPQDAYICNATTYQCVQCADYSDPKCQDKATACANCQPPAGLFRCDKSNATNPQCELCEQGQQGCANFSAACGNCFNPPPPTPPPPTPPPPPQQNFTCDTNTLQCIQAPKGMPFAACSSQCSNSTPAELLGVWRGIQVQVGFTQGEYDFNFKENTVAITDPNGRVTHGLVTVFGSLVIKFVDGPFAGQTLSGYTLEVSYGPETVTKAFYFGPPNSPAPSSLEEAMTANKNGDTVYFLSQCHQWSTACVFKGNTTEDEDGLEEGDAEAAQRSAARRSLPRPPRPFRPIVKPFAKHQQHQQQQQQHEQQGVPARYVASDFNGVREVPAALRKQLELPPVRGPPNPPDPCNAFNTDCATCIGNHGQLDCGWCMGGNLIYNNTGDAGVQCGGYVKGNPLPFVCPKDFRTETCAGYSCNYTANQPQCVPSNDGEFSTLTDCQQVCKAAAYAKCNTQTKQCEPCQQGQPGCNQTPDECNASCNIQHQKCNATTSTCENCDPSSDPSCTQSAGDCSRTCSSSTYGLCDPISGKCHPCDPSSGQPGCVAQCGATCSVSKNFVCNNATLQCEIGAGNMTLQQCANICHNQTQQLYGCVWNSSTPQCVENAGRLSKEECETNCQPATYAKCNQETGQCQECDPTTDPSCIYTSDYCNASCHQSFDEGVWRGIEISQAYKYGEWDFTFYDEQTVGFWLHDSRDLKYMAAVERPSRDSPLNADGASIFFTITQAPVAANLPLPGVTLNSVLSGIFKVQPDETSFTQFMYLALSLPKSSQITTFNDGMQAFEWVLTGCAKGAATSVCNFEPGRVPN